MNAASGSLEDEFWRILKVLDDKVPTLKCMREAKPKRDVRQELEGALRGIQKPVLYVIDDIPEAAPDEDAPPVQHFCPALGAVTVLATSRQDTREEGVRTIEVDPLERDASILLLTENLPGARRLSWSDWGRVANWVGDLPLALDLLNRCLALNSISIEDLLDRVTSTSAAPSAAEELDGLHVALRDEVPPDSVRGIAEVFGISFERLKWPAREAALFLAQLAPAPIPEAFVHAMPTDWQSPAVRAALRSRHLVTGGDNLTFGVMHRLVADSLRNLAGDLTQGALEAACSLVYSFMTPDRCGDPHQWPVLNVFQPHAQFLLERAALTGAAVTTALELGKISATLAFVQAKYAEYQRFCQRMMEISTRALGREHPKTLQTMADYARALRDLGEYDRARKIEESVLETRIGLLGEDHPDVLKAMSDLAKTLRAGGEYAEARGLQERVLEKRMRQGEDHPDVLKAMSDLAETLRAQECYAEAQQLYERLLEKRTRLQGEDHPDTLEAMSDLARTLCRVGKYGEARALQERVLEKRRLQGEEKPNTLRAMGDLAVSLGNIGDLEQAKQLAKRALELSKSALGEQNPQTLQKMELLAQILSEQGDSEGAIQLAKDVRQLTSSVVGEQHPLALSAKERLADILFRHGDHTEAQTLLKQVADVKISRLGKDDATELRSMQRLAVKLLEEGERETSGRLLDRVLAGRMHVLGAEHPDTLTSMSFVGAFLATTGNPQKGLQLLRQCLAGRCKVLGSQHPDTRETAEFLLELEHGHESGTAPEESL